jgi:parallel beta-helix repeat protein
MKHLMTIMAATALLFAASTAAILPAPALAAQSYDNCTGFIDSLPATISKQGTWCLRHDLATNITSGYAISVATNNVTIDCNDFKLGGSAAGVGTGTRGIYANDRLNTTVRRCSIRGFFSGIELSGSSSANNLVEDNRFDGNTSYGLYVDGDNSTIRRNSVNDTGGNNNPGAENAGAVGIHASFSADILDNTINGVAPGWGNACGICTSGNAGGSIEGNRIRGLAPPEFGQSFGIFNSNSQQISIRNNVVVGNGGTIGLICQSSNDRAQNNVLMGFATPIENCRDDGNSL